MATVLLASPTSVFLYCTPKLRASLMLSGLQRFTETLDGWLPGCLESQRMNYRYGQASMVIFISSAIPRYSGVERDLYPCNEIVNPAVGPHQQKIFIVTQPSPDVYTLILIIDLS
jgi:hypothetical protein